LVNNPFGEDEEEAVDDKHEELKPEVQSV